MERQQRWRRRRERRWRGLVRRVWERQCDSAWHTGVQQCPAGGLGGPENDAWARREGGCLPAGVARRCDATVHSAVWHCLIDARRRKIGRSTRSTSSTGRKPQVVLAALVAASAPQGVLQASQAAAGAVGSPSRDAHRLQPAAGCPRRAAAPGFPRWLGCAAAAASPGGGGAGGAGQRRGGRRRPAQPGRAEELDAGCRQGGAGWPAAGLGGP